jgi:hypothetical protein
LLILCHTLLYDFSNVLSHRRVVEVLDLVISSSGKKSGDISPFIAINLVLLANCDLLLGAPRHACPLSGRFFLSCYQPRHWSVVRDSFWFWETYILRQRKSLGVSLIVGGGCGQ